MATAKKTRQTFSTAEHESEIGEHPPEYDLPSTLVTLTDEEKYLAAILLDKAGIDLVELTWVDEQSETGCYRLFPFQWSWWRCDDPEQIDQGARCLQGGQLVLTARGWQPIEEVLVGDLVLTHRNRWRRVTNRWDRGVAEVVAVAGQGPAAPLVMTPSHKLWARHAVRASKPRDGHKGKKLLEPGWARADELRMNDGSQVMATNWASPAEVASLPLPPQLEPSYRSGPQNLIADLWTPAWMWLYGLFLAEGSTYVDDRYARSTWSVHESEAAEVGAALAAVGLNFHEDRHADGAVVTLVANSRPLALWLREHAGHLAHNKEVAPWAHGLPVELRRAIYEGMVFGDGGHRGRRDSYTSSSRKLMLGFRLLAQSLGRGVSTWAGRKEGATSTLRGREITRRASWSGESQPIEGQSRGKVKVEDGHAWAPVTSVSPAGVAQVWDLEVEEDHSFVCEGVVVHNSLGKSESIIAQGCAFPFNFPTQEFLIVTPEGSHADALTERLEPRIWSTRLIREMLASGGGRRGITHHPFQATFANGARLMVRLPQRSGIGVKGCLAAGALVLTRGRGLVPIEDVTVGDEVRTHEHRWLPVLEVESFEDDVFEVRGPGSFPVLANGHHRMRGRWDESKQPGKSRRLLGQSTWGFVDDLAAIKGRINFYWQGPTGRAWEDGDAPPRPVGGWDLARPEAWWLIGRWLADGYVTSQKLKGGGRGRRRVHWVATPAQSPEISKRLDAVGAAWSSKAREHSSADLVEHCNGDLAVWLTSTFGHLADGKALPGFAFTLPAELRDELLAGYLSGDGCATRPDRVVAGSASKRLAVGMGIIAQGLGRSVGFTKATPRHTHVMGVELKAPPKTSYRVNVSTPGHGKGIHDARGANYKVRSVTPAGRATVYNLVTADHSYLADGIYHHNTHPVVLHLDEAQDLSEKTWEETPEIVRTDVEGHMTRAHGVSRGVQDDTFYAKTQPDSGWTVHRLTKMHRPDLKPYRFYDDEGLEMPFTTNDTRVAKRYAAKTGARMEENWRDHQARQYRGRSTSGFKRNVYGLHGNAMNRIFYLDRLMKCVDTMEGSAYNTEEYRSYILDADNVAVEAESRSGRRHDVEVFDDEQAAAIVRLVQLSPQHLADYKTFWIGMDVGIIGDPSEILVFAEYAPKDKERAANASVGMAVPMPGVTRFKLLARVKLTNVAPDLQAHLVMHLIDHYKPKAASIDRTGNGLAILRSLQRMAGTARMYVHEEGERPLDPEGQRRAQNALTHIKGYNFGEKVVIDIDEKIVAERRLTDPQEILDQAGIRQNVKDAATDVCRELVDQERLLLPLDKKLIDQLNAATQQEAQEPYDQYGRVRRIYGRGEFHALDAFRMMALGMDKQPIEAIQAEARGPHGPVLDRFG